MNNKTETTHFGYQEVPLSDKVKKVGAVFDSVASRYDLMNDLMSFGVHRLWKRYTLDYSRVKAGHKVLDLAGGTGDLSAELSRRVGPDGEVILADINYAMMEAGRAKLTDKGILGNLYYVQANAEHLPFPADYFDRIFIGFGLRNVTHKEQALKSMYQSLKPGGRCLVLEFSKTDVPVLKKLYDVYSFKVLPQLGRWVAGDAESYQYLAESIRMHPDQECLKAMMEGAGFEECSYQNLTGGIVAIHQGFKY